MKSLVVSNPRGRDGSAMDVRSGQKPCEASLEKEPLERCNAENRGRTLKYLAVETHGLK